MKRVRVVSDLHLEFMRDGGNAIFEAIASDGAFDILVVAGDLCAFHELDDSIDMMLHHVKTPIVYVLGNHEGYNGSWLTALQKAKAKAAENPRLHVLEQETCTIEGLRFVGCTLWYRLDPIKRAHTGRLTGDFRTIKDIHEFLEPTAASSREFLKDTVQPMDIVVTHHLPHPKSIHPRYKDSDLNWIFLHDVSGIVEYGGAQLWAHGHTHTSVSYIAGSTLVYCNPLGYILGYNNEPNPEFVIATIEIPEPSDSELVSGVEPP